MNQSSDFIYASELFEKYQDIMPNKQAFLDACHTGLPTVFWLNLKRFSHSQLEEWAKNIEISVNKVEWLENTYSTEKKGLGRSLLARAGGACFQEEVSLIPVSVLDCQPGDRVVDMCASPGGKSAQASFAVGPTGCVVSNERYGSRIAALGDKINRMGLGNIVCTQSDATGTRLTPESFDRAIVDVPCSGEGMIRKVGENGISRPFAKYLKMLPAIQGQILRRALRLVKPGGTLVYSTCTFDPRENEEVLQETLGEFGRIEKIDFPGLNHEPGLTDWNGKKFRSDMENCMRFWPQENNTGGFFVAKITRTDVPFRNHRQFGDVENPDVKLIEESEKAEVFDYLQDIYGIDSSFFERQNYQLWKFHSQVRLGAPGLFIPNEKVDSIGMSLLKKKKGRRYSLTHGGAREVIEAVTKNVPRLKIDDELTTHLYGDDSWKTQRTSEFQ